MTYIEIETQEKLSCIVANNNIISKFAFQDLDFSDFDNQINHKKFDDCIFLGCTIPSSILKIVSLNCLIFPEINVPYNPFINKLYSRNTLLGEYELGNPDSYEKTLDKVVYDHYISGGKEANDIKETLGRRLHDHSITDALYDFLDNFDDKKIVAVMGGHSLLRNDINYIEIARISKQLTEMGYLMISGGGPGAMEATHVGAWLAGKEDGDLVKIVELLAEAPSYKDKLWLEKAFQAIKLFPNTNYKSLGIPTWLYGHEPPTPFATDIAKYFANSVREDGLLAIAKGGVIFAPGSAGTIQEIFQDATQNHYLSFDFASPMVFYNKQYWNSDRPIYPLLNKMFLEGKYKNLILSNCDTKEEVITELEKFSKK